MTKVRRLLAITAFLGVIAIVSSAFLQGQQAKKGGSGTTPQISPAKQVSVLAEAVDSRFGIPGVLTYQPIKGDLYFALQLKPIQDAAPQRPRDILIMMSTAATQAGTGWIASHQIALGVIETAREFDRVALWTVNSPENTRALTKDFLTPKDYSEGKRLREALKQYRDKEYPSGDTDLKNALTQAIKSFDAGKDRQRIILFLGDGLSTHNPMLDEDRQGFAKQMVERKIAFFPVPLGIQLEPTTLHGLANSTGGLVLRTHVEDELLVEALKRYETAFAGPILYSAKLQLPAEVTEVCPSVLPPLRSDSPTLVVGRLKKTLKHLDLAVAGTPSGRKAEVLIKSTEPIQPANLDNYFLVGLVDQWVKAKESPAILRADRALVNSYEQTRLQHLELLENAQMALQENKVDAAGRLFKQARQLAPHDKQADAGVKVVDRLKDGSLTREAIQKLHDKRLGKADKIQVINGKAQWNKVDLIQLVQNDEKIPALKEPGVKPNQPVLPEIAREDLLKEHRDRQAIEEQKISQAVDEAIRQAKRNLKTDPDGTLDLLRNLLNRVKDHPDLGAAVRDTLSTRLQASLRDSATMVQGEKLKKADQNQAAAQAQANLTREQERKSFVERVESQFRVYKNLMNAARYEEAKKMAVIDAMIQIQDEAKLRGQSVPVATKAMYDIALASYPLQQHQTLVRTREKQWLSVLMSVEKSHIPYPDEPGIYFPPLTTWKAIIKARKDKYEVATLPADPEAIKEGADIYRMLQQPIKTKFLQTEEGVTVRQALEYFSDNFKGRLNIVVDKPAFEEALGAEAADVLDGKVKLPPGPDVMVMNNALRLVLAQIGKGEATYLIRRSFIEITTVKNYLDDKVLRIYPVGDLVMPLSQGGQGGQMMGGMMGGGMGMGMPGMGMGMGMGMPGMGMGMPGMGMGMPGMGMPGMGMPGMGMGMPGMGMPGMGMGMPGMGMGMPGMGMPGMGMPGMGMGMPGMGMPGMGMPGMGMGMPGMGMPGMGMGMPGMGMGMPGMGGMPGQFTGGAFQGSFNGSLGVMGATQATGLINIITTLVEPGQWNQPPQQQPFMMMMMPFPGFMMGMMNPGMVGNPPGGQPDPAPVPGSNTINFFPPAMALIVRAPSRLHTNAVGNIVGRAKMVPAEKAGALEAEKKGIAVAINNKKPNLKVGAGQEKEIEAQIAKRQKDLDPAKVWNEGFAKGGASPALVIATADFLFEAGEFKHAAEFLKANLRHGVVVRPWVFEALAIALEMSGGDPEEVRRARLSGIALDPQDAQGFMSAARAMADRGQHDRALAFCKQAALLEPNDYHPYEVALAYAETAKDTKAMEWAVGKLVSQDWPVDNLFIQQNAKKRLESLVSTLKTDKRGTEADHLKTALQRLNQRDLIVRLLWDNAAAPAEVELKVKEPCGSICSLEQKQTPGGGIMIGYNLTDKEPNAQYMVSQAFSGDYEITVSRVYGQPLGNRARVEIIQNAGTPQQTMKLVTVRLDQSVPIKITLKDGRRTELATVSAGANQRRKTVGQEVQQIPNPFNQLRAVANPKYFGDLKTHGGAGTSGAHIPSVASLAARDSKNKPGAPTPIASNALVTGNGVQMTSQVRLSADQRSTDMIIRPFFQSVNAAQNRAPVNLSVIPGGLPN